MMNLSIIVPVYNSEKFLKQCLDSVCKSEKEFEVVIVDDGSTDGSAEICRGYATKDNRIKYFYKKNGGVSSARNYGIKMAKNDYLMFVDSDDILVDGWDASVDCMDGSDIIYCGVDPDDVTTRESLLKAIAGLNNNYIYHAGPYSKIYRKAFVVDNGILFDERIINGEDMLFNIKAIVLAKKYKAVQCHIYLYRQSMDQSTRKYDARIIDSDKLFHEELHKTLENKNIDGGVAKEIEIHCLLNAIILIVGRLSYAIDFCEVEEYYKELESTPYSCVFDFDNIDRFGYVLKLCKKKEYRKLFYLLRLKNRLAIVFKKMHTKGLVEV